VVLRRLGPEGGGGQASQERWAWPNGLACLVRVAGSSDCWAGKGRIGRKPAELGFTRKKNEEAMKSGLGRKRVFGPKA
jgi:hypothetical protein